MTADLTFEKINKFPLLKSLTRVEIESILPHLHQQTIKKNAILLLEGKRTEHLFFVKKGWLKAEKISQEGRQQTLRIIGSGEVINELAIFTDEKNESTVLALEDSQVLSLQKRVIEQELLTLPHFSKAVIHNLAQRIQHLLNLVENLSLYPVEVRLARYLLKEAEHGLIVRHAWKTQSEIAAQIGTVLDVVNRNLQQLANQKIISISRNKIQILDQQELERIAGTYSPKE